MINVGGGLSVPVKIQRGIRQGCPISGQLYSLAIEHLLCLLRCKWNADYNTTTEWCTEFKGALEIYERASYSRLNWDKTEAVWYASTKDTRLPILPNNIKWGKTGFQYLGVYLGQDEYKNKNCEGLLEQVSARLSSWKWMLPQLS